MLEVFARVIEGSWLVMGQMGPYLLFGFATAGVLSVLISPAWIERNLGSAGFWPVFKASLFGVPLPLCSCSVIPVSASMRRHGASRGATAAFLLSTPQTGVDSIAVNLALLGPVFAVFRPLAALLTGVFGGLLVESVTGRVSDGDEESADEIADDEEKCHECCCSGKEPQSAIRRVISYSFVTLPADIGPALLLGVIIAGAISAYVEPNELKHFFENETLSILLMMVAAIPIYVCATGVGIPYRRPRHQRRHAHDNLEDARTPRRCRISSHRRRWGTGLRFGTQLARKRGRPAPTAARLRMP